jgi:hypothetical protein
MHPGPHAVTHLSYPPTPAHLSPPFISPLTRSHLCTTSFRVVSLVILLSCLKNNVKRFQIWHADTVAGQIFGLTPAAPIPSRHIFPDGHSALALCLPIGPTMAAPIPSRHILEPSKTAGAPVPKRKEQTGASRHVGFVHQIAPGPLLQTQTPVSPHLASHPSRFAIITERCHPAPGRLPPSHNSVAHRRIDAHLVAAASPCFVAHNQSPLPPPLPSSPARCSVICRHHLVWNSSCAFALVIRNEFYLSCT